MATFSQHHVDGLDLALTPLQVRYDMQPVRRICLCPPARAVSASSVPNMCINVLHLQCKQTYLYINRSMSLLL